MNLDIRFGPEDSATTIGATLAKLAAAFNGSTALTPVVTAPQPPAPAVHPITADRTSESLIANEAARVAGEHTGSTNTGGESPLADSSGLPWDERIHSLSGDGSKPLNANGTWRRKRGVSDELVAQVEAELRGSGHPTPQAPVAVPVPPAPAIAATAPTTAPPAPPVTPAVVDTASGQPVATTAAEPAVPAPPADGAARFPEYADLVRAVSARGLPYQALNEHAASMFGVAQFIDLRARPDTWDMFYDALPAA